MTPLSSQAQWYLDRIKNSFFGRWIVNYKVSFLIIILIILYGLYTAFTIPKESTPDIKFGIVSITTVYPWANPVDIDDIITTEIEDRIKDLDGIDSIESASSLGVSSVVVTLENGVDTRDFITDVRNKIDMISFPDEVKDTSVVEISTMNEVLFQMILYGPKDQFTMNHIKTLALELKDQLKWKWGIVDVGIDSSVGMNSKGITFGDWWWSADNIFDIEVLLDQQKLEWYGLTVAQVVGQIRAYNQNLPLGNYTLWDLDYDYRIDNELSSLADLQNIPILVGAGHIRLWELANLVRHYHSDAVMYGWIYDSAKNHAVSLTIYKKDRSNVFAVSDSARTLIEETLRKYQFNWLSAAYTRDLAEIVIDDYESLGWNGITSVTLVFLITRLFIGTRQSLIATLSMPIAFFITFMILNYLGMTMNFMVNFSLILSFGMGIDTVIVFVESARENMKLWYNPKTAILITMHTYARPNIITSLINIVVFIPMFVLPWVIGKFLSNIPITLFATLLASLFLALTVNGALFARVNKKLDYYYDDDEHNESLAIMTKEEREILAHERVGKRAIPLDHAPKIEQLVDYVREWYVLLLRYILDHAFWRKVTILLPVWLILLTFVTLAPRIGFKLFPSGDNPYLNVTITTKEWTDTKAMIKNSSGVDTIVAQLPEIKSYTIDIHDNTIDVALTLVDKELRSRDSFQVQDDIMQKLSLWKSQWYKVESKVLTGGPPTGKAIGIKLVADDKKDLLILKKVSKDFEEYLSSLTWTLNITNSSTESPGQFNFSFDQDRLAELWLTPTDVQNEIYSTLNWIKAGTLLIDNEERDIVVKWELFSGDISPETLYNLMITTKIGSIRLSDIAIVSTNPALTSIKRVDHDLVIVVESDLESGIRPTSVQPLLLQFADSYEFPDGISYQSSWENAKNADLISAAITAFFIALSLAFILLVYQFNSFLKPSIVLYSIFTALLGVNIGLWVTGNPYSMAFAIGFISLIGVVVNTAIFLVDRINENEKKWFWLIESIIEAGQARFKPIIISTFTTVLGISSSVTQDDFYAGLWYTVIFWLIFSAVITLVAVPVLYYAVFREDSSLKNLFSSRSTIFNKLLVRYRRG